MVNKIIKKVGIATLLVLALIIMLQSKVFATSLECTEIAEDKVKYVNVSMWDINGEKYNEYIRGIPKDEYYMQTDEKKVEDDSKALLFGTDERMVLGGIQNGLLGVDVPKSGNGVLQGLVENKLDDEELKTTSMYTNGKELITKKDDVYIEQMKDWQFPLLREENGYYSFDSNEYHVSRNYNTQKFELHKGVRDGFYPFNTCAQDTFNKYDRELLFASKFEIPFFMTEDGKVKNTKTAELEDMVFNVSGDDDVWVFIDDNLVVDLGGIHTSQGATLNLATNEVNYECVYNKATDTDNYNVTQKAIKDGKLSKGLHTIKVFYMERSGKRADFSIRFNLQNSGVKVKHIEKGTNKILKEEIIAGAIGETVETSAKEFVDHKLYEKPQSENIELTEDMQTVNYYYSLNHNLTVDYVDFYSKNKIEESTTSKLFEGDDYFTQPKNIKDYKLVSDSENTSGKMDNEDKKVTYYYKYSNAKIKANYIDKTLNKKIFEDERTGIEGEKTIFEEKKFDGYVLVEKPKSNEEIYTKKDVELNYYYKAVGKVTVNYIDNITKRILDREVIEGTEGNKVNTKAKQIKNYIIYKLPKNDEYIINREDVQVNYYYIHQSKVTINYIDQANNKNLEQVNKLATEGSIFESQEKQFENYKLVKKPENSRVTIGKNDIIINYYYEKLKFNLKVEMNLKKAYINDHYYELKGKIGKIEAEIREANSSSSVKVFYNVKVKNTEERIGSGTISVELPKGYIAKQEDNPEWQINDGKASFYVNGIHPAEERNIELVLIKASKDDISGTIRNVVKIESDGIEEVTLEDNKDYNDLVITPRTGIKRKICYIVLITIAIVFAVFTLNKANFCNYKNHITGQN